ncbi:MAG: hypothetical protein ACR2OZ_16885 [Verrucomicrobiales bacterium]
MRDQTSRGGRRVWLRLLTVGFVILLSGGVALVIGIRRYLHSDGFRVFVGEQASRALHASSEFSPIVWQDDSASAERFTARGGEGSPFTSLDASGLRARVDFQALWNKTWRIPQIDVDGLEIVVSEPLATSAAAAAADPSVSNDAQMPAWLSAWIPHRVRVDEIAVQEASFRYARGGQNFLVDDVAMTLRPGADGLEVRGQGGRVQLSSGRKFVLENILARVAGGRVFLTEVRGHSSEGGTVAVVSGDVSDERLALRVQFTNLGAAELLAEDWKQRLRGRLEGEAIINGPTDDPAAIVTEGRLAMKESRVEFLPLLEKLARHTRHDGFRSLLISNAQARFRRQRARLEVREFAMESPGLLRVEGHCDVIAGRIDGVFQVGVAPGTLRWMPGAENRVFTRAEDGFLWTSLRLVGPVDAPHEDLSGRLVDAAVAQTVEDVPRNALKAAEKAAQTATDIGGQLIDKGSALLEQGSEILKGFAPLLK